MLDATSTEIFRYQYDPLHRLTNRWSAAKGNTVYKYDPLGNLTNVVYPVSSSIVLRYDTLNRLTNMVDGVGATAFSWTDGDQLASEDGPWAGDTISYSYTDRLRGGVSLAQPNAFAWAQSYGYDEFMRLTNVSSAAGVFSYPPERIVGWISRQTAFQSRRVGFVRPRSQLASVTRVICSFSANWGRVSLNRNRASDKALAMASEFE